MISSIESAVNSFETLCLLAAAAMLPVIALKVASVAALHLRAQRL